MSCSMLLHLVGALYHGLVDPIYCHKEPSLMVQHLMDRPTIGESRSTTESMDFYRASLGCYLMMSLYVSHEPLSVNG